jgi:hypothetical protein
MANDFSLRVQLVKWCLTKKMAMCLKIAIWQMDNQYHLDDVRNDYGHRTHPSIFYRGRKIVGGHTRFLQERHTIKCLVRKMSS